ncbi:unnamed protein product [Paramecium sonneborni]|uniref:Uncharacterized protein n=1 Tax=Paramecium sonneborni TaxID=65129 RepID=A0A8S1RMY8_9CILI|nr:unnamed protein product [Paramecium sonneborni]
MLLQNWKKLQIVFRTPIESKKKKKQQEKQVNVTKAIEGILNIDVTYSITFKNKQGYVYQIYYIQI